MCTSLQDSEQPGECSSPPFCRELAAAEFSAQETLFPVLGDPPQVAWENPRFGPWQY